MTPIPTSMQGYYIQANYHFLPQWLTDLFPNHFRQEVSTFTAVARWNQIFLNGGLPDTATSARGDQQQIGGWFELPADGRHGLQGQL